GAHLLVHLIGNIDAEGRLQTPSQVSAEIIDDALRMPRLTGDFRSSEFCIEASIFGDFGDRDMIGMRVQGIRHKKRVRAMSATQRSQLVTRFNVVNYLTVLQSQQRA